MILIVGLGNPGTKYKRTRHNIGFWIIEEFAKENNFPDFQFSKKFQAEISKGSLNRKTIIIAKPQAFMNNSGKAVKSLKDFYKIKNQDLLVAHDDIDIPLEKIRVSKGQGAAGHKGVQSIINELGAKSFIRCRVGILPKKGKPKNPEDFVTQKFAKTEEKIIKEVIKKTCQAIKLFLKDGLEKAMTEFN